MAEHWKHAVEKVPALRGISHACAFIASLGTGTWLILSSTVAIQYIASALFGGGLTLLFGASALFHRWRSCGPRGRRALNRLDHSMIFVLIASSFTAFALLRLHGGLRWTAIGIIGGIALAGVIVRAGVPRPPRWLLTAVYIGAGWLTVAFVPAMHLHLTTITLLTVGGVCYTVGAIVYVAKRPNPAPRWFGFHEVFHLFTIVAAVCQYAAVYPLVAHVAA